ncbi:hypothetical protein [Streptomyces sp. 7-21]|uniref:hypothetical protein n=1 Tax=Streptomyces sp. 7-21 TaxID=2802283 RepID=UPI00191E8F9D|nr:hypothetical protein [Streptomyces sp. 7-21]MBL1065749.1 hypothetical protein [Streptomyces sp. 7-21]
MSTGSHGTRGRRAARRARAGLLALLVTAGTACGIQSTDVPVDGGPAPTRATCESPGQGEGTEVYLVCGTSVEAVTRSLDMTSVSGDPVAVAQALLAELQSDPGQAEQAAGFSSDVPPNLEVSGVVHGGEIGTGLRLSQDPADLPAFALVQIVCTFARSELGDGHSVVLSGPPGSTTERPKPYSCSNAMRASSPLR